MASSPKDTGALLKAISDAWEKLAPAKKFAEMTLAEFKAKVQPSFDARTAIDALDTQMLKAIDDRDDADKVSVPAAQLVVNSVKGDPAYGDDSALYEAMGYVRKSERKSGLTKAKKTLPAPPAK